MGKEWMGREWMGREWMGREWMGRKEENRSKLLLLVFDLFIYTFFFVCVCES